MYLGQVMWSWRSGCIRYASGAGHGGRGGLGVLCMYLGQVMGVVEDLVYYVCIWGRSWGTWWSGCIRYVSGAGHGGRGGLGVLGMYLGRSWGSWRSGCIRFVSGADHGVVEVWVY